MSKLNIVIPMAGHGSRFTDVGYSLPKPLIDVAGKTMIELVIKNIRPAVPHRFIFICLREHYENHNLHELLNETTGDSEFEVVVLEDVTDGAARTILQARHLIDTDDDLLTVNSDQFLSVDPNIFIKQAQEADVDGLIMTFKDSDPKWSFAKTDEKNRVVATAEKVPISDNATVGVYYFRRGKDFIKATESMIRQNAKHNGEYYVCPVYNELITNGAHIQIHEIDVSDMHGLGTPEDLDLFIKKLDSGLVKI